MKTRQELKEDYKKLTHPKGVYKITCTANGKIFLGGSPNLDSKWSNAQFQLDAHSHPNSMLQADWEEYGADNFTFEVVDTLDLKDYDPKKNYTAEINELEAMYLEELQPFGDKGYNKMKS
ncbi:MAG: GIY-YIG nuclease family protein [Ignavibacteria bacterium]|jgi:hypothetical protein|nr:GIY-YIG nuclease family protein [Ignavibacteria bacterium]